MAYFRVANYATFTPFITYFQPRVNFGATRKKFRKQKLEKIENRKLKVEKNVNFFKAKNKEQKHDGKWWQTRWQV